MLQVTVMVEYQTFFDPRAIGVVEVLIIYHYATPNNSTDNVGTATGDGGESMIYLT